MYSEHEFAPDNACIGAYKVVESTDEFIDTTNGKVNFNFKHKIRLYAYRWVTDLDLDSIVEVNYPSRYQLIYRHIRGNIETLEVYDPFQLSEFFFIEKDVKYEATGIYYEYDYLSGDYERYELEAIEFCSNSNLNIYCKNNVMFTSTVNQLEEVMDLSIEEVV
jgi:hypothetical protein